MGWRVKDKQTFAELLNWHLFRGTRPNGKLKRWSNKDFGYEVGDKSVFGAKSIGTVMNWRRGRNLPNNLLPIEFALFGDNEEDDSDAYQAWRRELRKSFEESDTRTPEAPPFKLGSELPNEKIRNNLPASVPLQDDESSIALVTGRPVAELDCEYPSQAAGPVHYTVVADLRLGVGIEQFAEHGWILEISVKKATLQAVLVGCKLVGKRFGDIPEIVGDTRITATTDSCWLLESVNDANIQGLILRPDKDFCGFDILEDASEFKFELNLLVESGGLSFNLRSNAGNEIIDADRNKRVLQDVFLNKLVLSRFGLRILASKEVSGDSRNYIINSDNLRLVTLRTMLNADSDNFNELVQILGLEPQSDFRGQSLRGARFGNANLDDYNFTGADLRGADLRHATYDHTIFRGIRWDSNTLWRGSPPFIPALDPAPADAISKISVVRLTSAIADRMNASDRNVLFMMMKHITPNRIVYVADIARHAYPSRPISEAVSSFERFRMRFKEAANRAASALALMPVVKEESGTRPAYFWFKTDGVAMGNFNAAVRGCVFAADGNTLIAVGDDGQVRFWDWRADTIIGVFAAHDQTIWACALSHDGALIATASADTTLKLWDAAKLLDAASGSPSDRYASGPLIHELRGDGGYVRACAFSPGGDEIVSISADGFVRIWNTRTGKRRTARRGHNGAGESCAFSPVGNMIASSSQDGTLAIWNAKPFKMLHNIHVEPTSTWVTSCSFSPDGALVACGSHDGRVYMWNAITGKPVKEFPGHMDWVKACSFSPDGNKIASTSDDMRARIWDVRTGQSEELRAYHKEGLVACAYSRDGRFLATGASNGRIRVWDANSFECVADHLIV